MKDKLQKWITEIKKLPVALIGCLFLIVVSVVSLAIMSVNPFQASPASALTASFSGKYKIGDGDWQTVTKDGHISATEDDVTLRGNFIVSLPNGEYLTDNPVGFYFNFYCNHLLVKVSVGEESVVFDTEYPPLGAHACGTMWVSYQFPESADGVTEITISNPHKHGNEMAIDEFLQSISMEDPTLVADTLAKRYDPPRYVGFSFIAMAIVVFVLTIVASIAKLKVAKSLWVIAFWILFTGGVYILDVADVFFWNGNLHFNTAALCLCQILSSFFLSLFATNCLTGKNAQIGGIVQTVLGVFALCTVVLSALDIVRIFDIRFYWYIVYALQVVTLCVLGAGELPRTGKGIRIVLVSSLISMLCSLLDFFAGALSIWSSLYLSKTVFGAMLVIVILFGISAILSNYKISMRTKEMETELKDKSIAVMISQIQPHFLYNSLNNSGFSRTYIICLWPLK